MTDEVALRLKLHNALQQLMELTAQNQELRETRKMPAVKMNLTMSTKISDLLDPDGQAPVELIARGRNLVNFLGEISRQQ